MTHFKMISNEIFKNLDQFKVKQKKEVENRIEFYRWMNFSY